MSQLAAGKQRRFTLLVIGVICALVVNPFAILFLLFIPLLGLFKITKQNFLVSIPIMTSLNVLLVIINAVALDTINLPVTPSSIIILSSVEAGIILAFNKKRLMFDVAREDRKYLYVVYLMFIMAIFSRVASVMHLLAPILHDPQAHASWANKIINERAIDYFYSPGLHIWTAIVSQSLDVNTARITHLLTNSFSAFSVLAWALMTYVFTKNARLAMWTSFILLILPLPQFLYFLAGKNALVMSVPFIAITAIFTRYFSDRTNIHNFLLLLLCLVGVGLIHYPAFAYAAGFTALYTLIIYIINNLPTIRKRPGAHITPVVVIMVLPIIAALILALNMVITKTENIKVATISSQANAVAFHDSAKTEENIPVLNSSNDPSTQKSTDRLVHPISALKKVKSEHLGLIKSIPSNIGMVVLGMLLIGLYFICAGKIASKAMNVYRVAILSLIIATFSIIYVLTVVPLSGLKVVGDAGQMLLSLGLGLALALMLFSISERGRKEVAFILLIAVMYSSFVFTLFRDKSLNAVVDVYDAQAFSWIEANVDKEARIIGSSELDPKRKYIVFPTDGALWIPVFTGHQISSPFQEEGFVSIQAHLNYEYTRRLFSSDLKQRQDAISYLTGNDYRYIYIDSPSLFGMADTNLFVEQGYGSIVYQNPEIRIIEINRVKGWAQ